MKHGVHRFAVPGLAVVALVMSDLAHAESGTVEFLASAVSVLNSVQMGDTTVTASTSTGTITTVRSSGGAFPEGASGNVQCARFSRKSASGFELEADCAATYPSGDAITLLFKRKTGDIVPGSSGEGTLQITGVSGQVAGVTGQCKYRVENLQANWNVTVAKCQWSR